MHRCFTIALLKEKYRRTRRLLAESLTLSYRRLYRSVYFSASYRKQHGKGLRKSLLFHVRTTFAQSTS